MYPGVAAAAEFFLRFPPDQRTSSACRFADTERHPGPVLLGLWAMYIQIKGTFMLMPAG